MAIPPQSAPELVHLRDRTEAFATLLPLFRGRESFLVTSHPRPDGDAVGSALGMMHLLVVRGKRVTVAFADRIPRPFLSLPGASRIVHTQPVEALDVAIV